MKDFNKKDRNDLVQEKKVAAAGIERERRIKDGDRSGRQKVALPARSDSKHSGATKQATLRRFFADAVKIRKAEILRMMTLLLMIANVRSEKLGIFGEMLENVNGKECELVNDAVSRLTAEHNERRRTKVRVTATKPKSYENIMKTYRTCEKTINERYGEQSKNCIGMSELIQHDSALVGLANEMVGEGPFTYTAEDWENTTLSTIVESTCTSAPECTHWLGDVWCACDDQGFGGALTVLLPPPNKLLEEEMALARDEREAEIREKRARPSLKNRTGREVYEGTYRDNDDTKPGGGGVGLRSSVRPLAASTTQNRYNTTTLSENYYDTSGGPGQ
jgi:hypothetical protein